MHQMGSPGGTSGKKKKKKQKKPPDNAGDIRDRDSIPGLERSPRGGHSSPLQYSCLTILWTEEPGGLCSIGSQRVGQDWSDLARKHTCIRYTVSFGSLRSRHLDWIRCAGHSWEKCLWRIKKPWAEGESPQSRMKLWHPREREGRTEIKKKKQNAQITGASEVESAQLVERTQAKGAPWRKSKLGKKLRLWSSSSVESWARMGREAWPKPECRENPQIQQGGCQVPCSWCS